VRQNDPIPGSTILRRLKAEEAYKELERRETRLRVAARVRTVWRERSFLFRISALGLIVGLLVAFLIPARYTSTTALMPPDNQSGSSVAMAASMAASRGAGGFGQIAGDLLGLNSTSDVFVGILSSRTVQNHIIDQFDLKRVYGLRRMADARLELASQVRISVDRKSQIITISVTDNSPQRAESMARAYVDQLNRLVSELSTSSARRERIFLEGRLAQVTQDLETAEKELSQFASKNSAIDIKEQGKAIVEAAATVQGRLMVAQSELEELRQIYSDSSVRVRAVKARIAELQSQLAKFGGKDQTGTRGPETDSAEQYPSIRQLPLLGVTYADLYRRTKVQEAAYEVLTQEYEIVKAQEAREIPTVKVLDPADIPEKKTFPPRLLIGISTMFLACIGGIVLLFGSKSWNERDPHDLSKAVATEIWIDLKEKRFLNSVNGVSREAGTDSDNSVRRKRRIFSFFGLNNVAHNGNDFCSSSDHVSGEEP
jgi:capsule polysaccharide export protein KpsE/RkpR